MPRLGRVALLLAAAAGCASPKAAPAPAPVGAAVPTPVPAPTPVAEPAPHGPLAEQPDTTALHRHLTTSVRLAFVGDINLGTATIPGGVPSDSGRALLAAARPALSGDLVIGNFEGVLADSGETEKCGKKRAVVWRGFTAADSAAMSAGRVVEGARPTAGRAGGVAEPRRTVGLSEPAPPPRRKPRGRPSSRAPKPAPPIRCYAFLTPTLLAPRLAEAGFTHLNLANNHANDFGLDGRGSTEATLASLGLATYGPLGRIVVDTVRRADAMTIVGVIGFTTYPFAYDLLDIPASVATVDSLRRLVDVVVVTFHGGAEGAAAVNVPVVAESLGREPRGDLRAWAHAVIDAGADAVVGHGPHVLRGIEFWKGKPIVYSL
ncbi:MAG TPA: CapA family protein, partial [Gemmatimonadales bacterium]